ncbi:MAG: DUF4399 domain-containing protein [Alphaproteobacteria bacterium]|nr:DUF4399 domain-containing protein [Alphaproteobacteria bacterium]
MVIRKSLAAIVVCCSAIFSVAYAEGQEPEARAYIISPKDGDHVSSPVTVIFGLKGMGVAPAGTDKARTGHHHLIIDSDLPPLDENIPADEHHIHFGGGQTEVELTLAPGKHTLQLLLGDMNHIPHKPAIYSEKITITVKP